MLRLALVSLLAVDALVNQKEVKAVMCRVCELAVENAIEQKVTEESVDDLCIPNQKTGRWLSSLNIQDESDGSLYVENMGSPGECRSECSTVARACSKVVEDTDRLVALVAKQRSKGTIIAKMCKKACKAANKGIIVNRKNDEAFKEVDPKMAEMQDMMKDMKQKTGMGMKMYSRDDFASMSEGDMEAMAAREQLSQERMEDRARNGDIGMGGEEM